MTIDELKAQIDSTIKSNGQRLITGAQLNSILNAIATYTAEVEGVSLKVPQFLPFDSIIANANVQVGSTSATDYEIVYVESKNVFTAYTGGVYYTDWVGSLSYNKGTFSKSAIATNLYINPYAEIYKIENSKLVAIQKYDIANVIATYGDGGSWATLSYKGNTIYPETKGQQVKLSIGGNADDAIKQNSSNIVKEKERAQQVEMYLESQKANKYGYYENLSVGVSDNLSGRGEATDSEFAMRPSGGENKSIEDGTARINTIKGNSVVYNQFVKDPLFETENNINWLFRGHSSYNVSNGTVEIISNGNGECYIDQFFNFIKDHVYLFMCDVKGGGQQSGVRAYYEGATRVMANYVNKLNEWERIHVFVKTPIEETGGSRIRLYCTYSGNVTSYFRKPRLIDLTKMFGAGNEPTTVEEFEALYSNMPNEYNEGTIIDNHTSAIKSVGVNAWDEEWEFGWIDNTGANRVNSAYIRSKNYIPVLTNSTYRIEILGNNNTDGLYYLYDENKNLIASGGYSVKGNNLEREFDTGNASYIRFYINESRSTYMRNICIHLVHTGYLNGKYFPYEDFVRELPTIEGGLKSAGSVCDEIRYNVSTDKWEYVKRIGQVDLGTLEWYYSPATQTNSRFIQNSLLPNCAKAIFSKIPNIISNKYTSVSGNTWLSVLTTDKSIGTSENTIGGVVGQSIVVVDKQYTDVATFKQAMQGVILYYELAEPIVAELDVDISPDYKVWDYGTEEAISEVLSTPVRINANYGFNAVGQITDNTELIKELLARVAVLEAQVAQANSANVEPMVE